MRSFIHAAVSVCILALAPCDGRAEPVEAVFSDPAGDGDIPSNDLLESRIQGKEGRLVITGKVAESPVIISEFEHSEGAETYYDVDIGRAVTLYIDSDGDEATGETPFGWEGPAGFDYDMSISFCFDVPDEPGCPRSQAGATGGRLHVYLMSMDFNNPDREFEIQGLDSETFTVEVPYEAIGVGAGDTIRVFVDETFNVVSDPDETTVQKLTLG